MHSRLQPPLSRLLGYGLVLCVLGGAVAEAAANGQNDASESLAAHVSPPLYNAVLLDQQGRLAEALPLYRAQAAQTLTKADRLRYAAALLRAGHADDAQAVYAQLMAEEGPRTHGGDQMGQPAGLCASSLLAAGFPALAVDYARQAQQSAPDHPTFGVLLVRALCASGDRAAARARLTALGTDPAKWVIGQRLEVARWHLLIGDATAADRLLDLETPESVGQMFRDSILANAALRDRDWAKTIAALAACERKVPAALTDKRVDRTWRNAQRELWSVRLRSALSLWKQGQHDAALKAAAKAKASDEEYVRSAAVVVLVSGDLAQGRRTEALTKLTALAGHDTRFAAPVAQLQTATTAGTDAGAGIAAMQAVLASQDRCADFITVPLFEVLSEATQPTVSSQPQARLLPGG